MRGNEDIDSDKTFVASSKAVNEILVSAFRSITGWFMYIFEEDTMVQATCPRFNVAVRI